MAYLEQSLLGDDVDFGRRVRSALTEQSGVFINDARPQFVALAESLLRGDGAPTATFLVMVAAAPGFADTAADGDGGVDSSRISDSQILSAVQAEYPTVAGLYFDEEGNPKP